MGALLAGRSGDAVDMAPCHHERFRSVAARPSSSDCGDIWCIGCPCPLPQVVRVGLPELRRLMLSGDMLLPSVTTCFLALERLQQQGLLK